MVQHYQVATIASLTKQIPWRLSPYPQSLEAGGNNLKQSQMKLFIICTYF
jgi:hypothetical protein